LEKNKYDHIISALPDTMDFIEIPDCVKTYDSSMTSRKSLTSLKNALKITTEYENVSKRDRLIDDAKSLARYQFGYDELLYDSIIRNRKIIRNNKHICTLSDGIIKLTLEGGKLLAQKNIYHVTIENFKLTGDVLSPGVVDADSRIRIGDEVVVIQNEQVIGIGTAMMSYTEMVEKSKGIAVKVRCRRHGLSE
jgi:archaeosine synthase